MVVNTVSGSRKDFGEALAHTRWEHCCPELTVPHTQELQPNRARLCSPTGLEQEQDWPAGTWSSTCPASTVCKLTWKAFRLTHFTSHLPRAKSTHAARSAAQLMPRNAAPGIMLPCCWTPGVMASGDVHYLCVILTSAVLRRGRAMLCSSHCSNVCGL